MRFIRSILVVWATCAVVAVVTSVSPVLVLR